MLNDRFRREGALTEYWYTLWMLALAGLMGVLVEQLLGYRSVGLVYLCVILGWGLFFSWGPLLFAALALALLWDYAFIPPRGAFHIQGPDDALMIIALLLCAFSTGLLTRAVRRERAELEKRERRAHILYRFVSLLAQDLGPGRIREALMLGESELKGDLAVFQLDSNGALKEEGVSRQSWWLLGREAEAAREALQAKVSTGQGSTRHGHCKAAYYPLPGHHDVFGVLGFRDDASLARGLDPEREELIKALCRELGAALERDTLEQRSQLALRLKESEKLHQALLGSLSHELRSPLTSILGMAETLAQGGQGAGAEQAQLGLDILSEGRRLNRLIENLLDMTRLQSGLLAPVREWQDPSEIAHMTCQRLAASLPMHKLHTEAAAALPLIKVDFRLIENALANLILNAARHTPQGGEIILRVRTDHASLSFDVSDQGPGVDEAWREKIFEKFVRAPGSANGGMGLGLYIAREFARAHGGELSLKPQAGPGATFSLALPLQDQPLGPAES